MSKYCQTLPADGGRNPIRFGRGFLIQLGFPPVSCEANRDNNNDPKRGQDVCPQLVLAKRRRMNNKLILLHNRESAIVLASERTRSRGSRNAVEEKGIRHLSSSVASWQSFWGLPWQLRLTKRRYSASIMQQHVYE